MCAPVVNRDVNQLELGRRPWSSPTLDLGRRSRVEEREVDPESGDYGPTRAVMFALNPTIIEVDLQIKGTTESEDEHLSFLVAPLRRFATRFSHLFNCSYTSKLSTLEFKLGHIAFSVEATIFVRVVHGSWPDCYRAQSIRCLHYWFY